MFIKGEFLPLFFMLGFVSVAKAGSCLVALSDLSRGDVLHLSSSQARDLNFPDSRYVIVQDQDEKHGPAFRPVTLKKLKNATQEEPVNLKRNGTSAQRFKKNNKEEKVERIGKMTVRKKRIPSRDVSPYDTSISQVDYGVLVRSENGEYWVVLNWKNLIGTRSGEGSDFVPDEKRIVLQTFRVEDGTLRSETKAISVGGFDFSRNFRVKIIKKVSDKFQLHGPLARYSEKTVRNRFTEGDVFRYLDKIYVVRNSQEGKFYAEGSHKSSDTWDIDVFSLSKRKLAKIEKGLDATVQVKEITRFHQEGGQHGYLGDFVAPVEFLGNLQVGLSLKPAQILKLIQKDATEIDPDSVEVPVVYDFVPED